MSAQSRKAGDEKPGLSVPPSLPRRSVPPRPGQAVVPRAPRDVDDEAAPPVVEAAPPVVEAAPPVVEAAPPVVEEPKQSPPPRASREDNGHGIDLDGELDDLDRRGSVVEGDLTVTDMQSRQSLNVPVRVGVRHHEKITGMAKAVNTRWGVSFRVFWEICIGMLWEQRAEIFRQCREYTDPSRAVDTGMLAELDKLDQR